MKTSSKLLDRDFPHKLWFQNYRSLNRKLAGCNERNLAASCFIFLLTKNRVCWAFAENVGRRPVILCTRAKKVENEISCYKEMIESIYIYIYIYIWSSKSEGIPYVLQNQSLIGGFQLTVSRVIIIYIDKRCAIFIVAPCILIST